jgi:hypothetical protein
MRMGQSVLLNCASPLGFSVVFAAILSFSLQRSGRLDILGVIGIHDGPKMMKT